MRSMVAGVPPNGRSDARPNQFANSRCDISRIRVRAPRARVGDRSRTARGATRGRRGRAPAARARRRRARRRVGRAHRWARRACTASRASSTTTRCATSSATRRGPGSRSCPRTSTIRSTTTTRRSSCRARSSPTSRRSRRTSRRARSPIPRGAPRSSGCTPTGAGDKACMTSFVQAFGRRAFRRPLTDDEVTAYLGLQSFAVEAGDFYAGVDLVVRAVLQDPSFLYRVEIGAPVAGRAGPLPARRLRDRHAPRRTSCGARRRATSCSTWRPPAASRRPRAGAPPPRRCSPIRAAPIACARFHAFWLGYHQLPVDAALGDQLRAETDALVTRVVLEKKADYLELFRWPETFLTDSLAMHYGLPAPGLDDGRVGRLPGGRARPAAASSRTAPCSRRARSSTTRAPRCAACSCATACCARSSRRRRPNVMVDQPPAATASGCKVDRYAAHRAGACAGCHNLTDPIGFGLENYDRTGVYRATDKDAPQCADLGRRPGRRAARRARRATASSTGRRASARCSSRAASSRRASSRSSSAWRTGGARRATTRRRSRR